jgi:hypothetical protein
MTGLGAKGGKPVGVFTEWYPLVVVAESYSLSGRH